MMKCFLRYCVNFNSSLLVLLILLDFILYSLHCKVAYLVADSFLHLFVWSYLFQVASVTCGYLVKDRLYLGY